MQSHSFHLKKLISFIKLLEFSTADNFYVAQYLNFNSFDLMKRNDLYFVEN